MPRSTAELVRAWKALECRPDRMEELPFSGDRIRVAPATRECWQALERVVRAHGYYVRRPDTDSYNCRTIRGGRGVSLHSCGLALDINWGSNPLIRKTPPGRKIRFSSAPLQHLRALDVKNQRADTDMTPAMIDDVLAIRTAAGRQLFTWGGSWITKKDPMHFQLDVTPAELTAGIDWTTVVEEDVMFVRKGDKGAAVEYYQRKLARLSPVSPGGPDGKYGTQMVASVDAFQESRVPPVLEGTSGDYIGPWTKSELDRAEAHQTL